jgi:sugar phosphate isomerase/epimerase
VQARAADADVKVAIEMHPHNIVYNPATMERLATEIDATHVGAEMDPSHLFWQGIEPIEAVRHLGGSSTTRPPRTPASTRRPGSTASSTTASAGSRPTTPTRWPRRRLHAEPLAGNASWDFVAVGRGHDVGLVARFLEALGEVDPDMAVNIEHEDQELDQMDGLRSAAGDAARGGRRARRCASPVPAGRR